MEVVLKNTPVKLMLEINTDKVLIAQAMVGNKAAIVELNPFSSQMTTEQKVVRKAEQQANLEAESKTGKPTKKQDLKPFTRHMRKLEIISEQQKR